MKKNDPKASVHFSTGFVKFFILFLIYCHSGGVLAFDKQREHQYAKAIEKKAKTGSAIYLNSLNHKFLALYQETESLKNLGTVILLHDKGQHPDQEYLFKKLRTSLPQHNWATLALQMPLREMGAESDQYYTLFTEAKQRIQAGIDFLKTKNINNIILLGYGLGGLMALSAASEQNSSVTALVTISLLVPKTDHPLAQTLAYLNNSSIPLLDIYGSKDINAVSQSARQRRIAAKENQGYRQLQIEDANRSFRNYQDLVVKRVYSWLSQTNKIR